MVVTPLGITREEIFAPEKADEPMFFKPSESFNEVSPVQELKAPYPIDSTLPGITKEVKDVQPENANLPIDCNPFAIFRVVRLRQ